MPSPSSPRVDTSSLIPDGLLRGQTERETQQLQQYAQRARAFLESFAWCTGVRQLLYGVGAGGVIAVFFADVLVKGKAREWLWVVTGDLPAAYLPEQAARTPCAALAAYCEGAAAWAAAVQRHALGPEHLALAVEASAAVARDVAAKVGTVQRLVLPALCTASELARDE